MSGFNNNHNSQQSKSGLGLAVLFAFLGVIAALSFVKGCNRPPYKLCTFNNYSVDGIATRKDNVIRLYDEDSVLYVNDARYPLITIQKQLINNDNTWILGSYLCVEYFDTIYIGVESKNGFIKSVTLETDIIGVDNEINPKSTTIESYY